MTYIADASSIILLSKVGLLQKLAEKSEIIVPQKVYQEVSVGKSRGRSDALEFEQLVSENKIKVVAVAPGEKEKIESVLGIFAGENEVVAYARTGNAVVLTDDKKCINAAKSMQLEFITTLDIIVDLQKRGIITAEKGLNCLERLETYGWYKHGIIDAYRRLIK